MRRSSSTSWQETNKLQRITKIPASVWESAERSWELQRHKTLTDTRVSRATIWVPSLSTGRFNEFMHIYFLCKFYCRGHTRLTSAFLHELFDDESAALVLQRLSRSARMLSEVQVAAFPVCQPMATPLTMNKLTYQLWAKKVQSVWSIYSL